MTILDMVGQALIPYLEPLVLVSRSLAILTAAVVLWDVAVHPKRERDYTAETIGWALCAVGVLLGAITFISQSFTELGQTGTIDGRFGVAAIWSLVSLGFSCRASAGAERPLFMFAGASIYMIVGTILIATIGVH